MCLAAAVKIIRHARARTHTQKPADDNKEWEKREFGFSLDLEEFLELALTALPDSLWFLNMY